MTNTEALAPIATNSRALIDHMTRVSSGLEDALTVLLAVEQHLIDTGYTFPSAYGTDTLSLAFTGVSDAATTAKLSGRGWAAESREQFRLAFVTERSRRK